MKDIALYEKIPSQKNNNPLKIRIYDNKDRALLPHWHEHIELLYFFKGECDFISGGKKYAVRPHDLVVVNSTEIHSYVPRSRVEYICILIFPEFMAGENYANLQIENQIRDDSAVDGYIENIHREFISEEQGRDMMLRGAVYSLMAHLMRHHTYSVMSKREYDAKETRLRRLDTVMEFISENYAEKLTTRALADMCYLTEEHFCRFFKKTVGKSAIEYINEYRTEKAAILLKNTDESISHIAFDVGYDDLNYFSRVFRRYTGQSPGQYRARSQRTEEKSDKKI